MVFLSGVREKNLVTTSYGSWGGWKSSKFWQRQKSSIAFRSQQTCTSRINLAATKLELAIFAMLIFRDRSSLDVLFWSRTETTITLITTLLHSMLLSLLISTIILIRIFVWIMNSMATFLLPTTSGHLVIYSPHPHPHPLLIRSTCRSRIALHMPTLDHLIHN